MGKSDEYIEYDAYMRYLKKVTVEQAEGTITSLLLEGPAVVVKIYEL